MKIKLSLLPINGGAFNCAPAREIEIEDENILSNNVILPWEFNPHKVTLWVIGNEFGALCAVWADCGQDAMDEGFDAGLLDSFAIDSEDFAKMDEDEKEDVSHLGNASEPVDLTNAWMQRVRLDKTQDCELLCRFAEARGNGCKSIYF